MGKVPCPDISDSGRMFGIPVLPSCVFVVCFMFVVTNPIFSDINHYKRILRVCPRLFVTVHFSEIEEHLQMAGDEAAQESESGPLMSRHPRQSLSPSQEGLELTNISQER